MAQKLHEGYGYSYDTLKVLLGGWSAWKTAGYPTAADANSPTPGEGCGHADLPQRGNVTSDGVILTPAGTTPTSKP